MPKPCGTKNADHSRKRAALLEALRDAVTEGFPLRLRSYRELARAAGVSTPTLRHYFGGRDAVVAAIMASFREAGADELAVAAEPSGPFPESVRQVVGHLAAGFEHGGLTGLTAFGLVEGFRSNTAGPAVTRHYLDPTLDAVRARLDRHVERGEMLSADTRVAALQLVAPILLVYLHQDGLCGRQTHAIDLPAFCTHHANGFIRAYVAG